MVYEKEDILDKLYELLNENRLSIFAGSGISVDSGLPTWDGFIHEYIEMCSILNKYVDSKYKFTEIIEDAKKCNNPIDVISALKQKVLECEENAINTSLCNDYLNKIFYKANFNDYHKIIVSTNYKQIITTNYDNLLEVAALNCGYGPLITRSYTYSEYEKISAAIYANKTAIIHAHGKIQNIKLNDLVLTRNDYNNIIKNNFAFSVIINTIFMTSSVLFVGYGGSDPHFEDIICNLNALFEGDGRNKLNLPKCYLMLKRDKITPIRELLNSNNSVDIIAFDNYEQMKLFLKNLCDEYPRVSIQDKLSN